MIYELRIYRCVHGRLPALLSRPHASHSSQLPAWRKGS
jgi:hypothetical protein